MTDIPAEELERGVTYRIDHRGVGDDKLPSRLGVFEALSGTRPYLNARFTNVQGPDNFRVPGGLATYLVDDWTFRKSAKTITTEKAALAIGLPLGPDVDPKEHSYALPDDLERLVKKFGGSLRRRKTRKHKRVSRKTRRSRK